MSSTPGVPQRFQADRLKFPGLLPEETLVARAWLALHEKEYEAFDYNVRIGKGDDPGPTFSQAARLASIANSKLRVDAVGWTGLNGYPATADSFLPQQVYPVAPAAQATLIEFKRRAATGAVTQISTYFHLWVSEYAPAPQPALILACNTFSQTIVPAIQRAGIRLDQVYVDFSSLAPVFRKR
jgi:hypothetical protein